MPSFCACHLSSAIERLYAKKYPALIRSVLDEARRVEASDPFKDPDLFDIHMHLEETYIRPHLSQNDRIKMDAHHSIFRKGKFSREFFDAHAKWENDLFATLGQAA